MTTNKRWQELEQQVYPKFPTTYIEALEALVVTEGEKQALLEQNQVQTTLLAEYEPICEQ